MKGTYDAIGYSFQHMGGNMTYGVIPSCVASGGYVMPYDGEAFFYGSLIEPLSCVVGAVHANYHTVQGEYSHIMEPAQGGAMAMLAAAGPMGLAMLDYVLHRQGRPKTLVVTDIDEGRLSRASRFLPVSEARKLGVELAYVNTADSADPVRDLRGMTGGKGFDDVFVFAPVAQVVEQADALLAYDGCLNFFAGPSDEKFGARCNFYNVHYNATHLTGTSGGNTNDMKEALGMATRELLHPAILVTHVGGLDSARDAILNLPAIPGGKKLIYNHVSMPLTAIEDFAEKGAEDPLFAELARICGEAGGLWSKKAEDCLLAKAKPLPECR
jgi:threonine dehydrogenase-like Zn-dependent dehydrogenase